MRQAMQARGRRRAAGGGAHLEPGEQAPLFCEYLALFLVALPFIAEGSLKALDLALGLVEFLLNRPFNAL